MKRYGILVVFILIAITGISLLAACDTNTDPIDVTVSFQKNGGVGVANDVTVKYGETYGKLPSGLTREGYTFDGWYFEIAGIGNRVTKTTKVVNKNAHTLYAKWIKNTENPGSDLKSLSTPNIISISNDKLLWSPVSNAESYVVDVYGKEYETQLTNYPLEGYTVPEMHGIKIKAVGDGVEYGESAWSDNLRETIIKE